MTRMITFLGARGGQGTSTIAAAAALFAASEQPTVLVSDDPAATAALIGIPVPVGDDCVVLPSLTLTTHPELHPAAQVIVVDAGRLTTAAPQVASGAGEARRYVVLRGPCYVALATILAAGGPTPDGLILLMEPGRALSERDVSDVLGIPIAATIAIDPAVARSIDAGILTSRLARTRALAPLRPLICDPFHRVQEHTDLPRPQCGRGVQRWRGRERA